MPKRGGSKGKPKPAALARSLMDKIPEENELWELLLGLGDLSLGEQANSRAAAIFAGAYLEHALKSAITIHLHEDPELPGFDYLFSTDEAPMRDFSDRIRLAKALGVISLKDYRDLQAIQVIRNLFAHSKAQIDFSTPEIADLCATLTVVKDFELAKMGILFSDASKGIASILAPHRKVFASAVVALYWKLIVYPGVAMPSA